MKTHVVANGLLSWLELFLFRGALFPPLIALVGSVSAQIGNSLAKNEKWDGSQIPRFWPFSLVLFTLIVTGQFVIGSLFNEVLKSLMWLDLSLILLLLPLSLLSAWGKDSLKK